MEGFTVSADAGSINRLLSDIYNEPALKDTIFSGSTGSVTWLVGAAPTAELSFSDADWNAAVDADLQRVSKFDNAFGVTISQFRVNDVICKPFTVILKPEFTSGGRKLNLNTYALFGEITRDPLAAIIIPVIMKLFGNALRDKNIPELKIAGTAFQNPLLGAVDDRLHFRASVDGNTNFGDMPPVIAPVQFGLSRGTAVLMINSILKQNIRGHTYSESGSQDIWIATAKYDAHITIEDVNFAPGSGAAVISVNAAPGASAGLKTFFGTIGVNYTGSVQPNPFSLFFDLDVTDNVSVRLLNDNINTIILEPHGDFSEIIISSLIWPLTQILVSILKPMIINNLRGSEYKVFNISPFNFSVEGARFSYKFTGHNTDLFTRGPLVIGGDFRRV